MAWNDVVSGAGTGASTGAAIGSIIPGLGTALGGTIGGLAGGALGGLFAPDQKETKIQTGQRELIDQLLASLSGEGPYSDLFNASEDAFQKSYVEPAKQRFQSQISPQIQQSYIQGGQQRSTGLQDTLARAGVDLDQMLNQQYMDYLQRAQQNQMNAIGQILGQGAGVQSPLSPWEKAQQGVSGYLGSEGFGKNLGSILSSFGERGQKEAPTPARKGFENPEYLFPSRSGREYGGMVS